VVDELKGHAGIGQHRPEDRHAVEQAQDRPGQPLGDLGVGQAVDQERRVRAGDDARPQHIGDGCGAAQHLSQYRLDLGLLG